MNDQSPPKRITRARAAAKETGTKTTRSATASTASSKAKITRAASITKRKTRSDDQEDGLAIDPEQIIEPEPHHTRGRPKKATHPEPAVEQPARKPEDIIEPEPHYTRGGSKRVTHPEPAFEGEMPAPAPEKIHRGRPKKVAADPEPAPTRSLRGRTVKIEAPHEETLAIEEPPKKPHRATRTAKVEAPLGEPVVVDEPPKKAHRARATTVTKGPVSRKPTAPKKTVKFEEPDKENIAPTVTTTKGKAKVTESGTGLRAKPVRKPATATTRATRGRAKVTTEDEKQKSSPLSPKKITQITISKEPVSDDELALNEKTPMKPLMRSPIKPPGSIFNSAKKIDFPTSITVNKATISLTQNLNESIMTSPARRPPQSPFKDTMKASPQRIPLGGSRLGSPFKFTLPAATATDVNSSFKTSLLQSPARRPASPTKVSDTGSPSRSGFSKPIVEATPKVSTFKISRFETPRTITKSVARTGQMLPPRVPLTMATGSPNGFDEDQVDELGSDLPVEPNLSFSGRLSSIVPRDIDAVLSMDETIVEEPESEIALPVSEPALENELPVEAEVNEDVPVDELDTIAVGGPVRSRTTTPTNSPPRNSTKAFQQLRDVDEDPFQDSDSEDELASNSPKYSPIPLMGLGSKTSSQNSSFAATPTPFASFFKTPKTAASQGQSVCRDKIGFTPLARQLNDWCAASPSPAASKAGGFDAEPASPTPVPYNLEAHTNNDVATQPSPMKNTFFDDEMSVRDEMAATEEIEVSDTDILAENFEPVEADEQDFALANEADELSMLEPDEIEAIIDNNEDMFAVYESEPAPSEASQEYGDENAIPIDPQLLALSAPTAPAPPATPKYTTPKRVLAERVFHTVSKVPLKPAAADTPMRPSPKKRSASISRLPTRRPSNTLSRNNTVISYSPENSTPRSTPKRRAQEDAEPMQTTPKGDVEISSILATPSRTPRRDLNNTLLKGAVVFVDVYTSEGADASALFTELLTQMGARCVKTWSWNGNLEDGSKIGITHVVFKDGGKRTLEKAKETGGVVSCVGVGWVLDCERENNWLDETPYAVDTAFVPRGGHRRRKSMEPRALANLNGTLVPSVTPLKSASSRSLSLGANAARELNTPFTGKKGRRESVRWVPSPVGSLDDENEETLLLSPVPKTPAPETISHYGEDELGDETPTGQTPYFLQNEDLVQKTAPAGRKFLDGELEGGECFLSEKKEESVMMRLMAARRKSLQWAPKVGSPLAKGMKF